MHISVSLLAFCTVQAVQMDDLVSTAQIPVPRDSMDITVESRVNVHMNSATQLLVAQNTVGFTDVSSETMFQVLRYRVPNGIKSLRFDC